MRLSFISLILITAVVVISLSFFGVISIHNYLIATAYLAIAACVVAVYFTKKGKKNADF
jgi:purine-cytosine permease-like protein